MVFHIATSLYSDIGLSAYMDVPPTHTPTHTIHTFPSAIHCEGLGVVTAQ